MAPSPRTDQEFEEEALALFQLQYAENPTYRAWCDLIKRTPQNTFHLADIPFLPVEFFKNHEVRTGQWEAEAVYTSSTTTGGTPSRHFCRSTSEYLDHTVRGFEAHYGHLQDWTVLALLPSYLERSGSSLVAMAEHWVRQCGHPLSGFYLYNHKELIETLLFLQERQQPTLLLGVTFALLDLAEYLKHNSLDMPNLRIMETGGMKGKRKELIRAEVHEQLKQSFPNSPIDSEYGMTEMMSQAYLLDSGVFAPPPWLRVYTRDISDPLSPIQRTGARGALQIIDLANKNSCAFLSLSDQGRVFDNGHFEVYGRLDHSEIRGCNLMISL